MKNLNTINLKYFFLLFFVITSSFYAQNTAAISFDYLNPTIIEVNADGTMSNVPFYNSKQNKSESFNYIISQKKAQAPTIPKSFRNDLYVARIKGDGDLVVNNGNEKYYQLVVWKNDYPRSQATPFSTENEYTSRYSYFTEFYIGKYITNATYSIKEYIPAGRWGNYLTQNNYDFDFITNNAIRDKILTLNPSFKGVLNSLTITGN